MSCAPCGRNGLRIQQIVPPLHVAEAVGLPGGVMLPPKVVSTSGACAPSTIRAFKHVAGPSLHSGAQAATRGASCLLPAITAFGQLLSTTAIVLDSVWPSEPESQVRLYVMHKFTQMIVGG
jgi:hypothetical protein